MDSAFEEGFLKPIDLQTLNYFIRQGYPREMLFLLFTDSFQLSLPGSPSLGYRYSPPDDYGCSRLDPKHRCYIDWIRNAAFTGLTVEEKTGIGLNAKAVVNLHDFALIQFQSQQAAATVAPALVQASNEDLDLQPSVTFQLPTHLWIGYLEPNSSGRHAAAGYPPSHVQREWQPDHQLYAGATFGKWCFRISWNAGEAPGATYFPVAICLYSEQSKVCRTTAGPGDRARGPKLVDGHHADGTAKSSNAMLREHRREWHYLLRAGPSHDHQAHFQHISSADRHSNGALSLKARRRSARPTPTPARNKSN